jgi:putative ABC transport system permease protein
VGDVLTIGGTTLHVSAILFHEPDRIMEGHSTVLRAMVHTRSLDGTRSPAARASHVT